MTDKVIKEVHTIHLSKPLRIGGRLTQDISGYSQHHEHLKLAWVDRGELGKCIRIISALDNRTYYVYDWGCEEIPSEVSNQDVAIPSEVYEPLPDIAKTTKKKKVVRRKKA